MDLQSAVAVGPPDHGVGSVSVGRFERAVGLVIVLLAIAGAGILCLAVGMLGPHQGEEATEGVVLGVWRVLYNTEAPPPAVLLAAAGLAVLSAAGVAGLERRISNRARRSDDPVVTPLAPKIVMAETRGVYAGPVTVTVLIPAHDEEACLALTLASLLSQSHRPERVIVVADNCTDRTPEIARGAGVEVFETVRNTGKKAGALNQAIDVLLPALGENDVVMVMDADTTLDEGFLQAAVQRLTDDRSLMAIGGLFYGEDRHGLLGQF